MLQAKLRAADRVFELYRPNPRMLPRQFHPTKLLVPVSKSPVKVRVQFLSSSSRRHLACQASQPTDAWGLQRHGTGVWPSGCEKHSGREHGTLNPRHGDRLTDMEQSSLQDMFTQTCARARGS
jgi:hypothetical protein